jgi:hypothetical protein
MKEGYGYAMGLMDRKEEQTKNKNQIFISFHQSKSTPPSTDWQVVMFHSKAAT